MIEFLITMPQNATKGTMATKRSAATSIFIKRLAGDDMASLRIKALGTPHTFGTPGSEDHDNRLEARYRVGRHTKRCGTKKGLALRAGR